MQQIATFKGVGKLISANAEFGDVRYELEVWQEPGGRRQAKGTLAADDATILKAFHSSDALFLDLSSGGRVSVTITRASFNEGAFQVSGEVPGVL